ncbi:uncharacterized protein TNCV_4517951 [Trichonephila clavipes]|nr:uncharacterized protein TNCV_4517951 [Trichonephila clavipes]
MLSLWRLHAPLVPEPAFYIYCAIMMVTFGKIMSYEYHLCYAHAIHLAVCNVLYNKQIDLVENTVEVEDKSHEEEDNGESEELVEDLDKALDLEFESGVGTDALFHVTYVEKIP